MKVCIVGPSKEYLSGISYYTMRLANSLARYGEVSVVALRKLLPSILFPGRRRIGKKLTELGFNSGINLRHIDWNSPRSWMAAFSFVRREDPDALIIQWWTSSVAHLQMILKIAARNLKILEFHEVLDPLEESILPLRLYSRFMGSILTRDAVCVAHSNVEREIIMRKYGINPRLMRVMNHPPYDHYDPIPQDEAKKMLGVEGEKIILYFGLVRKYKGVPYLIDAFNMLPQDVARECRLMIVGEVWDDVDLNGMRMRSRYRDRIVIRDEYVPDEDLRIYFSACDAVVLPYLRASQSGVASIAVAFKKPVIVSEVGGLAESMRRYDGTFFVPPGNSEAIRDALMNVLQSRPSIRGLSYSWDDLARGYASLISELLSHHR